VHKPSKLAAKVLAKEFERQGVFQGSFQSKAFAGTSGLPTILKVDGDKRVSQD
jgi:hypothetical protein